MQMHANTLCPRLKIQHCKLSETQNKEKVEHHDSGSCPDSKCVEFRFLFCFYFACRFPGSIDLCHYHYPRASVSVCRGVTQLLSISTSP